MSKSTTPTTNNTSMVRFKLANDPSDERKTGKSLNLLDEKRNSWSAEPVCVKYSPKDDRAFDVEAPSSTANGGSVHRADSPDSNGHQEHQLVRRRNLVAKVDDQTTNGKAAGKDANNARSPAQYNRNMSFGGAFVPDERWLKKRDQLLKECAEYLERDSVASRYTKETFRRGFLNMEISLRLFQLFDHDEDGYLSQDEWIHFIKDRLLTEKQSDLAVQIESVAYELCGDSKISSDKFYQIFMEKGITDKIFRLIDKDNDGTVTPTQIIEVIATLTNIKTRTGLDKDSLEWLEQLFRQTVGNEKEIRKDDFKKILITKNSFFIERVFQIFDRDNSGTISKQEFMEAMHQFAGQSPDDKIKFLFKVYDLDGDGLIQHTELQYVMRACMEENGMRFSEEQVEDLTMALFEDADPESTGAITYDALKYQLEKHDGLLENLSISIDRWLVPPKPERKPASILGKLMTLKPYQLTLPYIKNNYVYLSFLNIYLLVNLILFVSRGLKYYLDNASVYIILARACGQCLNFNCSFTLVLMLRHCITYLRTRGFSSVLPLDNHIYLHKLVGMFIAFYSVLHTAMHVSNLVFDFIPNGKFGNHTLNEWLFTTKPNMFGLITGYANPTGVVLIVILLVMLVCSLPFVRRGGSFEIFYWTHLLYIPFYFLLIIHGPVYWMWLLGPGLIYLCERLHRFTVTSSERGKTYISSGLLLPSRVTHLVIKRPPHFDFHSGDYVFVNIPAIAIYEWHPFTISSAPEQEDYMWLHIRGVGEWTNRLHDYFEKEQEKLHSLNENLPITSPQAITVTPNGSVKLTNKDEELKMLKATLDNPLSSKNGHGKSNKRQELTGYTNQSFSGLPEDQRTIVAKENEVSNSKSNEIRKGTLVKKANEEKLHKFLLMRKTPLSKSLSMPDVDNRKKKRQRLMDLRTFTRSESEKSFDECQMRRARLQSFGLAYLTPQNKSLARSFRYMRHKPTIIAFKTPSLENYEARINAVANQISNPEGAAEEGHIGIELTEASNFPAGINYPIGKPLEIFIDGPYGAPSSHIFRAQHAVLVATGIGVTPFASILQSIMHRYWKARHNCPQCKYAWVSDIPPTIMNLRKVDFFWINRDQRSFEWFVNLLSQLEIEQAELGGAMERFLDMHMYITSALQKTDMKAVGLQLALDLLHEKEKRDLITGLKTRTNAGRPNWDKVFQKLIAQKKGKVTVFYCGPPELGRVLRVKCDQYGFSFRKEVF